MMMAARDQLKKPTDSSDPPPVKRKRKRPEEKALLDSTKHLNYDGPNQKGMTKPLKPIPVFKQVGLKTIYLLVHNQQACVIVFGAWDPNFFAWKYA